MEISAMSICIGDIIHSNMFTKSFMMSILKFFHVMDLFISIRLRMGNQDHDRFAFGECISSWFDINTKRKCHLVISMCTFLEGCGSGSYAASVVKGDNYIFKT